MPATYEPIATTTLSTSAATINFTSIPGTYTDLVGVVVGTSTADFATYYIRFNSDANNNYSTTRLYGSGSSAVSNRASNTSILQIDVFNGMMTSTPTFGTFDVFNYAGSTFKTVLTTAQEDTNGAGIVGRNVGLWRSTAAITSLELGMSGGSFASGTTATLYGILRA